MVLQENHAMAAMFHGGRTALEALLDEGADANAHVNVSCSDGLVIIFWLAVIAGCLYVECISKNMAHVCRSEFHTCFRGTA